MPRTSKKNPDFDRVVGGFVKGLRASKGWSLSELNEKANFGLTKSALSGIEHGVQQLSANQLFLLSKALNFSIDEFFNSPALVKFLPVINEMRVVIDGKETNLTEI